MASLNKVMLIGNLGKDAEIRALNGGGKKAGFSIATTERYKDKNSGEMVDKTEWHNIVAWNQLAEIVEKLSLKKGTAVFIEGKITQRSWDDPASGQKKYVTEIIADRMQVLTPRSQSQGQQEHAPAQAEDQYSQPSGGNASDDDLPF